MASNPVTSRHRLRLGDRVVSLPPVGVFVVGRGETADLVLDDRTASRRHALFRAHESGEVTVEDLGSVNGVAVNGVTISARTRLGHGDRVVLASSTLVFLTDAQRGSPTRPRLPQTAVLSDTGPPDTEVIQLEAALEKRDLGAAEAAASSAVTRAMRRGIDRELLARLERGLAVLGERDAFWLERLLELRAADASVPEPEVVARLQAAARAGRPVRSPTLRQYLDALAPHLGGLSTGDRFTYRRLESLLRQESEV